MKKINFLINNDYNSLFSSVKFLKFLIEKNETECILLYLQINIFRNESLKSIFYKNINQNEIDFQKKILNLTSYYNDYCNKSITENDKFIELFNKIEKILNKSMNKDMYIVIYNSYKYLKIDFQELLNIIIEIKEKYLKIDKNILEKEYYLYFQNKNLINIDNKKKYIKQVSSIIINEKRSLKNYEKRYLNLFYEMNCDIYIITFATKIMFDNIKCLNWNYLYSILKKLIKLTNIKINKTNTENKNLYKKNTWEQEWLNEFLLNKKKLGEKYNEL